MYNNKIKKLAGETMTNHSSTTYNGICCQGCFKLGIKQGKSLAIAEYIKEVDKLFGEHDIDKIEWKVIKAKLQAQMEKQ